MRAFRDSETQQSIEPNRYHEVLVFSSHAARGVNYWHRGSRRSSRRLQGPLAGADDKLEIYILKKNESETCNFQSEIVKLV
jgi:hypothetical protein